MYKYFHSRGLKNVADPRKMFCHVTGIEVEYTDESTFVARVSLIYLVSVQLKSQSSPSSFRT